MLVPVYFSRRHTVMLEGSVWQPVACEHCELEWAFEVRCGGIGDGVSPYFLDDEGASKRASQRAEANLAHDVRLAREGVTRNVACPGCHRYQKEMVESLRRTHGSSWATAGFACMIFGTLLALRAVTDAGSAGSSALAWALPSALFFVAGAALLIRRRQLRRAFDPNAPAERRAGPPSSPYRRTERSPRETEASEAEAHTQPGPAVITRAEYDAAPAPKPPIPWRST